MKEYLLLFDGTAKKLAATSQDADAMSAQLPKILPKRSMAEWMVGHNLKARHLKAT